MSRDIGKINPCINTQNIKHVSGIYRGVFGRDLYYYIQDSQLVPPIFPVTK